MIEDLFVVVLVMLTSGAAYLLGTRKLALGRDSFQIAVSQMLECIGAFAAFLAINLAVGVVIIFLIRSITPRFVALYILDDVTLIIFSVCQGIVFQLWWRRSKV